MNNEVSSELNYSNNNNMASKNPFNYMRYSNS